MEKFPWFWRIKKWRRHKFNARVASQKSATKFCNEVKRLFAVLADDGKTLILPIIGFGNAEMSNMKYTLPSLGIGLAKILKRIFAVIFINESMTSKNCNHCSFLMENSIGRRTMATYDGQHSRLVCKNLTCPFHSRPINRDQNSSKNIRDIMMFWFGHDFMPWIFRRYAEFLHPTTKNKA